MLAKEVKSPFTGGAVELRREWTSERFRREDFNICRHYYICVDTQQEFSNSTLDELNIQQVYNQYRTRHHIPFPQEVRHIREQYGLSATKMAEVLDFGINSYRQYEQGEMPSLANSKLIRLAKNPANFKGFLEEKEHLFSSTAFKKAIMKINELLGIGKNEVEPIVEYIWNHHMEPNEYTGFVRPNFEKVAHFIIYFAKYANPLKTRMNKLMFYCDFLNFKRSGFSISGCNYRAIQMGPVPSHFRELFGILESKDYINIEDQIFDHGGIGERFFPKKEFDKTLFSESELACMRYIVGIFEETRTKQIIALSHEEKAWIANQEKRDLINYQNYAYELKALE